MDDLVERHRQVCAGFARVAHAVPSETWSSPTPCPDWDARALVEHVIGFHDFLLLRPLGVRALRPREDPAARIDATFGALFGALGNNGVLDQRTELPGGGSSTPRTMIGTLTTDVLVHTWDLARAAGRPAHLDEELCARAYAAARATPLVRAQGMIGPEVDAGPDAPPSTHLVAFYGRDPEWAP